MPRVFEWDARKAGTNFRKHKVAFEEASTVFSDPLAAIFVDEEHSMSEPREIIVGHSILGRLIVVCFTERSKDRIRIFSARLATRHEQNDYEEHIQT